MSDIDFQSLAQYSLSQTHIFFMEEQVQEMHEILAKIDKALSKEIKARERYRDRNQMKEWVRRGGLRHLNQSLMYRLGVVEKIRLSEDWIRELWMHYESSTQQSQRSWK